MRSRPLSETQMPAGKLIAPGNEPETLLHEFGNHSGPLNENYWSVDDEQEDSYEDALEFLRQAFIRAQI